MIKINLGSGPNSARGWINYDWGILPILGKFNLTSVFIKLGWLPKEYDWKWPDIRLVDIRQELPDVDNSVDYIYCSHVLEHFEKAEAINILKECKRVLKKTGVIRIVLPDLCKIIKNYNSADKFNREYFGFDKDLYVGLIGKLKRLFIRGHEWMYDEKSAFTLLEDAGFKNIRLCDFGHGQVPDLKKLDLINHKKLSIYIEAGN